MEYTIQGLAKLAGISTRTLRYYDQIGLLSPKRVKANGYRVYGRKEVDALQQILFFKELGLDLTTISQIMKITKMRQEEKLPFYTKTGFPIPGHPIPKKYTKA